MEKWELEVLAHSGLSFFGIRWNHCCILLGYGIENVLSQIDFPSFDSEEPVEIQKLLKAEGMHRINRKIGYKPIQNWELSALAHMNKNINSIGKEDDREFVIGEHRKTGSQFHFPFLSNGDCFDINDLLAEHGMTRNVSEKQRDIELILSDMISDGENV